MNTLTQIMEYSTRQANHQGSLQSGRDPDTNCEKKVQGIQTYNCHLTRQVIGFFKKIKLGIKLMAAFWVVTSFYGLCVLI